MCEWMCVGTAPRDGTIVDLWVSSGGDNAHSFKPSRYTDCWFKGGYWMYKCGRYNHRIEHGCVSHWMMQPRSPDGDYQVRNAISNLVFEDEECEYGL